MSDFTKWQKEYLKSTGLTDQEIESFGDKHGFEDWEETDYSNFLELILETDHRAYESQLLASREEVARLREAISLASQMAKNYRDAHGSERNITVEEEFDDVLAELIDNPSTASPSPAKTCRWKLDRVFSDYENTECGELNVTRDNEYKFCPYCGLPIEEVKEETT